MPVALWAIFSLIITFYQTQYIHYRNILISVRPIGGGGEANFSAFASGQHEAKKHEVLRLETDSQLAQFGSLIVRVWDPTNLEA